MLACWTFGFCGCGQLAGVDFSEAEPADGDENPRVNPSVREEPTAPEAPGSCEGSNEDCDGRAGNGFEADLASHPRNCGACGIVCGARQVCDRGQCGAECSRGLTQCRASCVDLTSDVRNCGACDRACTGPNRAEAACRAGVCVWSCQPGFYACDIGCCAYTDAGTEGGAEAGRDGGSDAGTDAGTDGGIDAWTDAGWEAGTDASTDTGVEGGTDAGTESGTGGGSDAGIDSGTDGGSDAGTCTTYDCRCLTDFYDTAWPESNVETALGTQVTCSARSPFRVPLTNGSYYYVGDFFCVVQGQPDPARVAGFSAEMQRRGFHGYTISGQPGSYTVSAFTSTRDCATY